MPPAQSHGARPPSDRVRVARRPDAHPPDLRERSTALVRRQADAVVAQPQTLPRRARKWSMVASPQWPSRLWPLTIATSSSSWNRSSMRAAHGRKLGWGSTSSSRMMALSVCANVQSSPDIMRRSQPRFVSENSRSISHGQSISSRASRAALQAPWSSGWFVPGTIGDGEDSRWTDLPEHGDQFADPGGTVEEDHDDRRLELIAHAPDSIAAPKPRPRRSSYPARWAGPPIAQVPQGARVLPRARRTARGGGAVADRRRAAVSWTIDAASPDREMCSCSSMSSDQRSSLMVRPPLHSSRTVWCSADRHQAANVSSVPAMRGFLVESFMRDEVHRWHHRQAADQRSLQRPARRPTRSRRPRRPVCDASR